MMNMNPYEVYKRRDLETCNDQELVGKLFNEASMAMKRAVRAIEEKKYDVANNNIKKGQVIVATLDRSLDMQYEIADQLHDLYNHILRLMFEANLKKDGSMLGKVSIMLADLRDTWSEAIKRSKKLQATL